MLPSLPDLSLPIGYFLGYRSILTFCRCTKPRPNGGTQAAMLKCSETPVYLMLPLSPLSRAVPYWENTHTAGEHFFLLGTPTLLLRRWTQPFSSMRSECVCMRGVSGACACGRVSKYNHTIIYSAIWSSRLEGQTGIRFNYLLLVSAASVTQA